jgi:hypothetical protein
VTVGVAIGGTGVAVWDGVGVGVAVGMEVGVGDGQAVEVSVGRKRARLAVASRVGWGGS